MNELETSSIERLGDVLIRLGALTQQQVEEIHKYQAEHPGMLFGQAAVLMGLINDELLDKYL